MLKKQQDDKIDKEDDYIQFDINKNSGNLDLL